MSYNDLLEFLRTIDPSKAPPEKLQLEPGEQALQVVLRNGRHTQIFKRTLLPTAVEEFRSLGSADNEMNARWWQAEFAGMVERGQPMKPEWVSE